MFVFFFVLDASGICRSRTEEYHNNDPNSNNHNRVFKSETRSNIYPPQLHFESLYTGVRPFQHRTLPLSVSLSSPLPSTSDSCDRQIQFATFSSAVNISSSDGDEPSCGKIHYRIFLKNFFYSNINKFFE